MLLSTRFESYCLPDAFLLMKASLTPLTLGS